MVAASICGLAPNAEVMLAVRALQGLSAAIIAPAALSMVGGLLTTIDGCDRAPLPAPRAPQRLAAAPRRRPRLSGTTCRAGLLLIAGMVVDGVLITLTAYAQQALLWSSGRFGAVTALMTGLVAQHSASAVGARRVLITGTVALVSGSLLLAAATQRSEPVPFIVLGLVVLGTGMGTTVVGAHITAMARLEPDHVGVVAAVADSSFAIGTALGVALGTTAALAATAATGTAAASPTGARGALLLVGAVALVGTFVATDRPPRTRNVLGRLRVPARF